MNRMFKQFCPFLHIATLYIKLDKTSWTYSKPGLFASFLLILWIYSIISIIIFLLVIFFLPIKMVGYYFVPLPARAI